jgi:predicted HTH domain antitoxin
MFRDAEHRRLIKPTIHAFGQPVWLHLFLVRRDTAELPFGAPGCNEGKGMAVHRYQNELISLAQAASEVGVSWAHMREMLLERGIQPYLGLETLEEAEREIAVLREQGVSQ